MIQTTLGIAVSLSGLLAALNLSKPRLAASDWWILGWLGATAGAMLCFLIAYSTGGWAAIAASTAANSLIGCCPPFLYLYARAMAGLPSKTPALHFALPAGNLCFVALLAPTGAVIATDGAIAIPVSGLSGIVIALLPPVLLIVCVAYCWAAIRFIDRRAARSKELGASWADIRDLRWVRRWAICSMAGFLGFAVVYASGLSGRVNITAHVLIILLIQTALIAYVGFSGLRETRYFRADTGRPGIPPRLVAGSVSDWHAVDAQLRESRVWTDPRVTPEVAARSVGKSTDTVLALMQRHAGQSFHDLINQYRVEQAKSDLTDPAHADESVLTIGMNAGFGSKSSFYAVFQKHVGASPAAYRKAGKPD